MKKFLSDVLVDCNLTVSGTTSLGAATGVTVSDGDNSLALATTAWVTSHVSTNSIYSLSVPSGTTTIRLASANATEDVSITGAGSVAVSRVSDSEIRLTGTNNYLSSATFNTTNGVLTLGRQGLSDITVDLDNRFLTSESDTLDTVTSRDGVTTNTIGVGTVNVTGSTAGAELLTVDGTYGRLFTVTDDLSDSLFSVNTVAGLPALEVFADNTIKLGAFANPITIDSSSNISIPGTITASGYNDSNWNTAFNDRITAAAVSGTSTKTLTLTQGDGSTITASWTDIEGSGADGYVSNVALNGNSLDFTAVGSGFAGSIDLSTITSSFNATDVRTVYERVKNVSGGPLQKGTPLAVVPGQTSGNLSDVIPADASDPTRMPAVFILNEDLASEAEGEGVAFGNITGIDTSLYDSGTTVYVAPGGGWTADKPQGDNLIQNLGIITKSHPTNGGGVVMGAGRSNDVPNIPTGYAWVGDANHVATPTLLGSLAYSSATYDNYVSWNLKTNGVQRTTVQSGGNLDIVAGTNVSVSYGAGGVVTINSTVANTDTNYYVSGVSFNTSNGVLTLTRSGLDDLTVDLDGRYLQSFDITSQTDPKYLRSDQNDHFTRLNNTSYNDTPGFEKGVISLRPGSAGGRTGIGFSSTQNVNTENGQDYGYLWWYDDNNNYAFGDGSEENAALILGIQNDSSPTAFGGTQDAVAIESSSNIFFNPGLGQSAVIAGGDGPDFTQGKVYIGRAAEAYEVYHQGNLVNVSQLTNDAGYLTSFSETDTLDSVTDRGNSTTNSIIVGSIQLPTTHSKTKIKLHGSGNDAHSIGTDTYQNTYGPSTWDLGTIAHTFYGSQNNILAQFGVGGTTQNSTSYIAGDLGIGTSNPTEKLHVNQGHIKVQSPNVGGIIPPSLTIGQVVNAYQAGISSTGHATVTAASNVYLRVGGSTFALTAKSDGNVGIGNTNPQHKLDVAGNVKSNGYYIIGGDDAARIALGSGTGNPVAQEIASLGTSVHIGAFIDFTIYNDDKSAMRSGTLQLVFNAGEVMFNEVSTMDIGDTTPCILTAVNVDEIVSVLFEAPDPSFHIKYQIRTI